MHLQDLQLEARTVVVMYSLFTIRDGTYLERTDALCTLLSRGLSILHGKLRDLRGLQLL